MRLPTLIQIRAFLARLSTPPPTQRVEQVDKQVAQLKAASATEKNLAESMREVISALEVERGFIRDLQQKVDELELSHRDGSHRDIYLELDEIRAALRKSDEASRNREGAG